MTRAENNAFCAGMFQMTAITRVSVINHHRIYGGARGVMVIVVGNGHGNMSSNPGRD